VVERCLEIGKVKALISNKLTCAIPIAFPLTLAVILLYLWLIFGGLRVIKNGKRHFVDRHDRRDLSLFQIGLRWFERCVKNDIAFIVSLTLPAWILSGS